MSKIVVPASLKALHVSLTDVNREEALNSARAWLAQEQAALKAKFLASGDAAALLSAHTAIMDGLLSALYRYCQPAKPPPMALLASGGYGRGELFPYSDLDLLFLYEGKHAKAAARIAESLLYLLWDLGLKVGQAHRSIDETLALAREDITIRTNLLDTRFIAGKQAVFDTFRERFATDAAPDTVQAFVEAKLAERDARHQRFGDSRYVLEPNVKEGKGGLRDLHTLWWLARYIYPVERVKDLVEMKLLTQEEYRAYHQSQLFLWRVRAHLHYLAGRAEERLTFDRQHALAVALGFAHPSVNHAIARFMRRYFAAVRTVGSLTRIFCALLEEDHKRRPRKPLAWLWVEPWMLGHFRLIGERLTVRTDMAFEYHPLLMIEIFKVAQAHELDIHPRALQLMARQLHHIDSELRRDAKANAMFMDILLSPRGPEATLRRMSEAGVLGKFIPDFGRVIGQTQFNMYHVYTVDEHTLVALGILHAIEKGKLREELPLTSEVIHRVKMRRVLYLALFCHDIAKGRGGDHSELGERIVIRLAERFGFSREESETAAWLVRHHLLFSHTALKRDMDDPKAVQDFVEQVRTPERLKLLLALTAADIRAVGPGVWNAWKASLLRELYRRAEQVMGAGPPTLKHHETAQFREALRKELANWRDEDIDAYLELGGPAFWAGFSPARHAVIARMTVEAGRMDVPLLIDTRHDYERSVTEIVLCSQDQPALFSKLAGAMALAGANIIDARVFTLKNGLAVDVFQVQDAAGDIFDRPDRLARLSVYIEQALANELDLTGALAERAPAHISPSRRAMPPPGQVFIDNNASNICSVIELTGPDRTGFLYEVTQAIAALGLTVATAHISTYGTQAVDVFYVKDNFGMKITHEARMKHVREALLKAVKGN